MSAITAVRTPIATGTWDVDPSHSRVEVLVKHLGIATVRGHFAEFEGSLEVGEDLGTATARGLVKVDSVNTNEDKRDDHLRSADFFDVEQYEHITFQSKDIGPADEDTFEITGDLTLHGVTREITLKAEVTGAEQDPWGNERVGLEVTGQLNRGDYGMTFNQALGSGNMLVSDRVKLVLDVSAVKRA